MANIHRPSEHLLVKASVLTAITATTNNGTGVDTLGYTRALAVFNSAPSGAGTTSDCKLQESADNAAWVDVAGAAFAQVTTAGGTKIETLNVDLSKRLRYLRLVHTGAGASAAGVACGQLHLFNPRLAAPTQDVAAVSV